MCYERALRRGVPAVREWAELEALGVVGAAVLMKEHAAAERPNAMNMASRFHGVTKDKNAKAKPWRAQIGVTEDGKNRTINIGTSEILSASEIALW